MNLEVNKKYTLQYTDQFCFISDPKIDKKFKEEQIIYDCIFIGTINIKHGKRNIFFSEASNSYIMFGAKLLSYVLDEKKEKINKIKDQIKILQDEITKLENGKD